MQSTAYCHSAGVSTVSIANLHRGDEVAVLPWQNAPSEKVRELSIVSHVGPALVELESGGLYFTEDGQGMNIEGCIVPATEEHRTALRRRAK
jgi:hypothetical protein